MSDFIDFDYEADFESTDKQGGGYEPLPRMYARIWAESVDFPDTKDGKGKQAAFSFEVQEPEDYKGRKFREWWTILHPDAMNDKGYARGKGRFDKFQRAIQTVVEKGMKKEELLYKTFVAEIGQNEFNGKVNNQIQHFYYEDDNAKEPVPELGIIGDGTQPARAGNDNRRPAANDNAPAQPAKVAAGGGKRPW